MKNKKNIIAQSIEKSFAKIAPIWPLQNYIAGNSLAGFTSLQFEDAVKEATKLFGLNKISKGLESVNIHSIKWLKPFFDISQATIKMPLREQGLYFSFKNLLIYDQKLHQNEIAKKEFIKNLPKNSEEAIVEILEKLNVKNEEISSIIDVLVVILPGFAGHINYRANWDRGGDFKIYPASQTDFIALRLVIAYLVLGDKKQILEHLKQPVSKKKLEENRFKLKKIKDTEIKFRKNLFSDIKKNIAKLNLRSSKIEEHKLIKAQMVFCIDVRSEAIRRSIESTGSYETYGFAGFFGVPVAISQFDCDDSGASCPVLIKPTHTIKECHHPSYSKNKFHNFQEKRANKGKESLNIVKNFYQSLKYSFGSPFILAEALGLWCGIWMGFKTFAPKFTLKAKNKAISFIKPNIITLPKIDEENKEIDQKFMSKIGFSLQEQCGYALNALKMMGLTSKFAKIVILCGHGAKTENNAYASALDCGACGGRHGGVNAKILAAILNKQEIRKFLEENNIVIPQKTYFVAALHNTTNDEISIYEDKTLNIKYANEIYSIKSDLKRAQILNSQERLAQIDPFCKKPQEMVHKLASDWSQTRPEWGLAKNAAFIVGPRNLTKDINLESKSFLHSYNYEIDEDGSCLETIMTAPMVVAHWINSQYFFSTFDNVVYGSGSKITQNITGKIGVMQGNSSDIYSGLALQSVFKDDKKAQHEMIRLNCVICAPKKMIDNVIKKHENLQELIKNEWIFLSCVENDNIYELNNEFLWQNQQ